MSVQIVEVEVIIKIKMDNEDLLDWWVDYDKHDGVYFKDIPEQYRKEFNNFMIGQTVTRDENGDNIAYTWDVGRWIYCMSRPKF